MLDFEYLKPVVRAVRDRLIVYMLLKGDQLCRHNEWNAKKRALRILVWQIDIADGRGE